MKRVSKKQRLVDYMIASGNTGFTYTEVIKTLLKFRFGDSFKYDSSYRGYYSSSISGINNYLLTGSGNCGLYKEGKLYYAQYFDKQTRINRATMGHNRRVQYASTPWYGMAASVDRLRQGFSKQLAKLEKNIKA